MKEFENRDTSPGWGEYPGNEEAIPGIISVDENPSSKNLEQKVEEKLKENPQILEMAKRKGQDVIAFSSRHGKVIAIGVGIASLAAIVGGIILYIHSDKSKSKDK